MRGLLFVGITRALVKITELTRNNDRATLQKEFATVISRNTDATCRCISADVLAQNVLIRYRRNVENK